MPFKDKAFDYTIALHIAEHVDNPKAFCTELMRISKRGYIETPSKLAEKLLGESSHKYFVHKKGSILAFENKRKPVGTKWFYALFYYGRKRRPEHFSITVSNRAIDLLLGKINRIILVLWQSKPIRNCMYTRFEWADNFECRIK